MNTKVIGVSLGNNTSAAVVSPEKGVELAISEERLINEKNTKNFPINAIRECVKYIGGNPKVFNIGICSYEVINDRTMKYIDDHNNLRANHDDFYSFLREYIKIECNIPETTEINIQRNDHHESHRLPAAWMSGFLRDDFRTISVTYDGFGDGTCGTIYDNSTGELLAKEHIENSLGLVYQYVTGALGFKEHQHEGKITGLAAFGKPKYVELFRNIIDYNYDTMKFIPHYKGTTLVPKLMDAIPVNNNIHGFKDLLELRESVYYLVKFMKENLGATNQDIAASVQAYTERLISSWVENVISANGIHNFNITLSGGLFANVKLNYMIKQYTGAMKLFVLPPMGDEGTSIGTAIKLCIRLFGENTLDKDRFAQDELYLGDLRSNKTLNYDVIDTDKYAVFELDEYNDDFVTDIVPRLLKEKNIVCVSRGGSEFGPRALGNHSILFDASDRETNDYLNGRLNRTEFMPFAPISLDKYKDDLFLCTHGLDKTLKYMTISVPVTQEFVDGYKAAYHIDFTARPQILSQEDNSIIYKIIDNYSLISNKKALINTSFNLHNSPIIFDDIVAYNSFAKADLDALLLDDKLIVKRSAMKK